MNKSTNLKDNLEFATQVDRYDDVEQKEFALTTIDNPFNPLTHFKEWFDFDYYQMNYKTCELLDTFSYSSSNLSPKEEDDAIREGMKRIVNLFPGLYKIVERTL